MVFTVWLLVLSLTPYLNIDHGNFAPESKWRLKCIVVNGEEKLFFRLCEKNFRLKSDMHIQRSGVFIYMDQQLRQTCLC